MTQFMRVGIVMVLLLQLSLAASGDSKFAQSWFGSLSAGAMTLRVVFHLQQETDGQFSGTMDSPDQGARGIPLSRVTVRGDSLLIEVRVAGGSYNGVLLPGDSVLAGLWSQSGLHLPLLLRPGPAPEKVRKPQEPTQPSPYTQEEVAFPSRDRGITLAGTLTTPPAKHPVAAVVLISGSGPQDRNETVVGHRPFLVLADALTRRGIAVLRYDDRGVGTSTGVYASATVEDLALDAAGAAAYLTTRPEIDPRRIGLLGHSEGGLLASMVAAQDSGAIAFLILLASPGVPGEDLLLLQSAALARASGVGEEQIQKTLALNRSVYAAVRSGTDSAAIARVAVASFRSWVDSLSEPERRALGDFDAFLSRQLKTITSPWFRSFLLQDPRAELERVRCPVLAITGSKDLQVPPTENLAGIREALAQGGNTRVVIRELPGLNHLLQTAQSGLPSEYASLEETVAPAVLKLVGDWITTLGTPPEGSSTGQP